jgi:hypothetical protein
MNYQSATQIKEDQEKNMLKDQVDNIVSNLENGLTLQDVGMDTDKSDQDDIISGFDYLQDALDILYIVDGNGEYLGAQICVAFGGPTIWIDTLKQTVEGHWWQDRHTAHYQEDAMDIDESLRELWECR